MLLSKSYNAFWPRATSAKITETQRQLQYEFEHLQRKLHRRNPQRYRQLAALEQLEAHPLFRIELGGVRIWERSSATGSL
jgi:hypothetical protein